MKTRMAALFMVLVIGLAGMGHELRLLRRVTDSYKRGRHRRVSIDMKVPDRILELLQDSQLHSVAEIKAQIPLSTEKFALILDFLAEFKFIELMSESSEVKIKPLGLAFLGRP